MGISLFEESTMRGESNVWAYFINPCHYRTVLVPRLLDFQV